MNNTILPSIEDIARRLEEEGSIVIAPNFYARKGPGLVELREGVTDREITVERGFGELNEEDKILWTNGTKEVKRYLEKFTLPTLEDAVRVSFNRILQLRRKGITDYTDARGA